MKAPSRSPHAIVVGGSTGLGAAIAHELDERGHRVSVLARRRPTKESRRSFFVCDVADASSVASALESATKAHGTPETVIYSAGSAVAGRTLAVPEEAARVAFEVNFWGLERVVRAAFPLMAAAGKGTIILVSSIAASRAVPFEAHYAASKAAAERFLEAFALEAASSNVRVACVVPGYVDTGFLERAGWYGFERPPPVSGSGITPEDVAVATVRLAEGSASRKVLGWKENAIRVVDRLAPGTYDRLLRARVRRTR